MVRSWAASPCITPQAKIDDPKTPRPDDVEFDNEAYTNPKYAGTVWYIADHLRDPTKPIIPLAALPPAKRQLDADFIASISDALGHGNIRPRDRIRHGHRNLSTCSLTSVVAANWSGAYKYAKDIAEQAGDEVKNGWVEAAADAGPVNLAVPARATERHLARLEGRRHAES